MARERRQAIEYARIFGYSVTGFAILTDASKKIAELKGSNGRYVLDSGMKIDSMRHLTWMMSAASFYGASKAYEAGDVHERFGNDSERLLKLYKDGTGQDLSYLTKQGSILNENLTLTKPSNMSKDQFKRLVDSVMDYQNNNIAINAAKYIESPKTAKEAAKIANAYLLQYGATTYKLSSNGNSAEILVNQKISSEEYEKFKEKLQGVNHAGDRASKVNGNSGNLAQATESPGNKPHPSMSATESKNLSEVNKLSTEQQAAVTTFTNGEVTEATTSNTNKSATNQAPTTISSNEAGKTTEKQPVAATSSERLAALVDQLKNGKLIQSNNSGAVDRLASRLKKSQGLETSTTNKSSNTPQTTVDKQQKVECKGISRPR
jgi:hypothetical protein